MKPYTITIHHDGLASQAWEAARLQNPRKSNWRRPTPSEYPEVRGSFTTHEIRSGRYTNAIYFPKYTSFLHVKDKYRAVYVCGFTRELTKVHLRAPAGTEWDKDGSIVRSSDYRIEYHPCSLDFVSGHFALLVKTGLRNAQRKRAALLELASRQEARRHELETTRVNLHDSQQAGNCIAGSLRFAEERLRIPREQILAAPWLVHASGAALLATRDPAAERAVHAAFHRETPVSI